MRLGAAVAVAAVVAAAAVPAAASAGAGAGASRAKATPLALRVGLRPGLQLAAMRRAVAVAPRFFDAFDSGCTLTTPMLTYVDGSVMAGNFRDQDGGCYVWLNLAFSPLLTARDICKLTLHELGHLGGRQHSADRADVMYSPYVANPVPGPCLSPLPNRPAARRAHA